MVEMEGKEVVQCTCVCERKRESKNEKRRTEEEYNTV
jgi:hypothetical protein